MRKIIFAVFLVIFLFTGVISSASAHESFHWMQRIEKDRMLVVFYDLDSFKANIKQGFQVRLVKLSNGKSIPFTSADIAIETNGRRTKSFTARPDENYDIVFSHEFPTNGKYVLNVTLKDGGKQLTTAQFPILVGEGVKINASPQIFFANNAVIIILGCMLIIVGAYIAGMKRMHTIAAHKLRRHN